MGIPRSIREEYEKLLIDVGEDRFFKHILSTGILAGSHFDCPEIIMLDQAESFFSLFRTTGNTNYFTIGRLLRRISHKLYRENHKKNSQPMNKRFLNSVK